MQTTSLEVIPIGGIGEFGMNCTALRYEDQIILIDAGARFPGGGSGTDLGIDIIVPDISFLREHQEQLQAILLTHGHEDHAGGISYIINEIPLPIYATPLTLGLVTARLKERGLYQTAELRPLEARKPLKLGPFEIEPLHITHSFPDALCFAITTPVGRLIWTGDFKLDQTPIDGKLTDLTRLSHYGEEGVLALFSDSTNSAVPGLAPSEFTVYEMLRTLFRKAEKKIIISCFASSIHRIQIILDLAQEFDRKVVALGRSMVSNIKVAAQLKYLHFPQDLLLSRNQARNLPGNQLVILASGSQGEPMAAMSRIAVNEMKNVAVEQGDLAILSARMIPGNERVISSMTNHFYRRGAHVFDSRRSSVHVSGHGLRDDLKLMINLTRPQFFIPIHGEYRQLKIHASLAHDQGIPLERIHLIENGDVLQLSHNSVRISDKINVGRRFIDEGILKEVHEVVLRDRRYLSEDGFVVVILRVDHSSGELIGVPELISRGFVLMDTSEELMELTRSEIIKLAEETPMEEMQDEEIFKEIVRKNLKRFFRKKTGKRPMILPVTIEI